MRNPESKQFRYEIETRAYYLTNQRSDEKKSDTRGTTESTRVRVSSELKALNAIEINAVMNILVTARLR